MKILYEASLLLCCAIVIFLATVSGVLLLLLWRHELFLGLNTRLVVGMCAMIVAIFSIGFVGTIAESSRALVLYAALLALFPLSLILVEIILRLWSASVSTPTTTVHLSNDSKIPYDSSVVLPNSTSWNPSSSSAFSSSSSAHSNASSSAVLGSQITTASIVSSATNTSPSLSTTTELPSLSPVTSFYELFREYKPPTPTVGPRTTHLKASESSTFWSLSGSATQNRLFSSSIESVLLVGLGFVLIQIAVAHLLAAEIRRLRAIDNLSRCSNSTNNDDDYDDGVGDDVEDDNDDVVVVPLADIAFSDALDSCTNEGQQLLLHSMGPGLFQAQNVDPLQQQQHQLQLQHHHNHSSAAHLLQSLQSTTTTTAAPSSSVECCLVTFQPEVHYDADNEIGRDDGCCGNLSSGLFESLATASDAETLVPSIDSTTTLSNHHLSCSSLTATTTATPPSTAAHLTTTYDDVGGISTFTSSTLKRSKERSIGSTHIHNHPSNPRVHFHSSPEYFGDGNSQSSPSQRLATASVGATTPAPATSSTTIIMAPSYTVLNNQQTSTTTTTTLQSSARQALEATSSSLSSAVRGGGAPNS